VKPNTSCNRKDLAKPVTLISIAFPVNSETNCSKIATRINDWIADRATAIADLFSNRLHLVIILSTLELRVSLQIEPGGLKSLKRELLKSCGDDSSDFVKDLKNVAIDDHRIKMNEVCSKICEKNKSNAFDSK
jgi:hypothetical protein